LVGDGASKQGEDPMVEIRVAVEDAIGVPGLMRRLAGVFGPSAISFDRSQNQVRVESEWESRTILAVLEAVEAWLDDDGAPDSATLSVGNRSYSLPRLTPLAAGR
jgi:hypothetical protein